MKKTKASKVNIKLKTTNFEILTRTKSLETYTNKTIEINQAACWLFEAEWKLSKEKLSLRLVGVRVSDLKEGDEEEETTKQAAKRTKVKSDKSTNGSTKIMESFIKKGRNQPISNSDQSIEENLFELKESCSLICPHCCEKFEGNREFLNDHIDSCFSTTEIQLS